MYKAEHPLKFFYNFCSIYLVFLWSNTVCARALFRSTQICMNEPCCASPIRKPTEWMLTCGVLAWHFTTLPVGVFPSYPMEGHAKINKLCEYRRCKKNKQTIFCQNRTTDRLSESLVLLCRHKITTGKPMGAIAGIQRTADGPIEWSYHLPHGCQLSQFVSAYNE